MRKGNTPKTRRLPDLTWPLMIVAYSLVFGFIATSAGVTTWDDYVRLYQSHWLIGEFGIGPQVNVPANYFYPPLWELIMGTLNHVVFFWMKDELWVRHAVTFSLLPIGLCIIYWALRKEGMSLWGTLLVLAGISGHIRLIGHAAVNVKDFPGAIVFVTCAFVVWRILSNVRTNIFSPKLLIGAGIVSAIPYLVRSPLITLLPLSLLFLLFHVVRHRKTMTILEAVATILLPIFAALIFIIICSPALWQVGRKEIHDTTSLFVTFPWLGAVRFYGMEYRADRLPVWYTLSWLPLGMQPVAFMAFLVGCFLVVEKRRLPSLPVFRWNIGRFGMDVGLLDWMALVAATSYAGIVILHPRLYDEDRHILFVLLSIYVVGLMGLECLNDRMKKYLTIIMIVWSISSLWNWNIYSYIYRSPLLSGAYRSYHFMGDYWDVCSSKAGWKLLSVPQPRLNIRYYHSGTHVGLNNAFRRASTGFFTSGPRRIRSYSKGLPEEDYWYVLGIRASEPLKKVKDFLKVDIDLVWQDKLPTGETACYIYYMKPR